MDPQVPRGLRRLVSVIGPGLITGAADDDPSGIATYVETGAQFGYGQLWTALFVLPLLTAVQEASARVGAVTGRGLAAVMRERYGPRLVYAMVALLLVAAAPPLIAVLALISRSDRVMGRYRSGWLSTCLVWLACAGMAAAAIGLLVSAVRQ